MDRIRRDKLNIPMDIAFLFVHENVLRLFNAYMYVIGTHNN